MKRIAESIVCVLLAVAGLAAAEPLGVTVNGTDVTAGEGEGWIFADGLLQLTGAGPFVLSGTNTEGAVCVRQESSSTAVLSNLVLRCAFSDVNKARIPCYQIGAEGAASVNLRLWGANELSNEGEVNQTDSRNAGVLVLQGSTLTIDAADGAEQAELQAKGGTYSAAIGGSSYLPTGTIIINGGHVVARGGVAGTGIGLGNFAGTAKKSAGTIEINGGVVEAYGGNNAAGIGCFNIHNQGLGLSIRVTGGTVVAAPGKGGTAGGIAGGIGIVAPVKITGGNVLATVKDAVDADGNAVRPVLLEGCKDFAAESFSGVPATYGLNDFAVFDHRMQFWFKDGSYELNGIHLQYKVEVSPEEVSVAPVSSGVMVDDVAVDYGEGTGWSYADGLLTLEGDGPFVLRGTNTVGQVRVRHVSSSTAVLSNLVLKCAFSGDYQSIFPCYQIGAGEVKAGAENAASVRLLLTGRNELANDGDSKYGGARNAGIFVNNGSTLTIDAAEGAETAELQVCGGYCSAAIGGCRFTSTGTIIINGGHVRAIGGSTSAGIGLGQYGGTAGELAGTVEINGGVVEAQGGNGSAGIGYPNSHKNGNGLKVCVTGGTVTATQGASGAYGIVGLFSPVDQAVEITGGNVQATIRSPVNAAGEPVWCATLPTNAVATAISNIGGYSLAGSVPLNGGYALWLADGGYAPRVGEAFFHGEVAGAAMTFKPGGWPVGPSVEAALVGDELCIWGQGPLEEGVNLSSMPGWVVPVKQVTLGADVQTRPGDLADLGEQVTVNGFTTQRLRELMGEPPPAPIVGAIRLKATGIAVEEGRALIAVGVEQREGAGTNGVFKAAVGLRDPEPAPEGEGVVIAVPVAGEGRYTIER